MLSGLATTSVRSSSAVPSINSKRPALSPKSPGTHRQARGHGHWSHPDRPAMYDQKAYDTVCKAASPGSGREGPWGNKSRVADLAGSRAAELGCTSSSSPRGTESYRGERPCEQHLRSSSEKRNTVEHRFSGTDT